MKNNYYNPLSKFHFVQIIYQPSNSNFCGITLCQLEHSTSHFLVRSPKDGELLGLEWGMILQVPYILVYKPTPVFKSPKVGFRYYPLYKLTPFWKFLN